MTHPLIEVVEGRFGGKLTKGAHVENGAACFHEAVNVARGKPWSDDPHGMPSLIGLNDAPWSSDDVRTKHMLPVGVALWDWADWAPERRVRFARYAAEHTIRTVLPMSLRAAAERHPDATYKAALNAAATRCADEGTESAAWSAAESAWSAESAAWSTESARSARSAESAAWSARSAAESAESARSAAESAESARSRSAAGSAESAARSAESAAWSAESAADASLIAVCGILVEAAEASK
jgi:hypothetical protein